MQRHPLAALILALSVAGPALAQTPVAQTPVMPPVPAAPVATGRSGLDLAGRDLAVAPGDDFFAFANGGWDRATASPADRSGYGAGARLVELTEGRVAALIQEAARTDPAPGSETRKIADYYSAYMDEATIEARGVTPLKPRLDAIAAVHTRHQLAAALGRTLRADVDVLNSTNYYTPNLFGLWVAADLDRPTRYSATLLVGGLGMPSRDYYLTDSPRMEAIRKRYLVHIARVLSLAGFADAEARATAILSLERQIAAAQPPLDENEDVRKGDNRWSAADFATKAPGLDWKAYFAAAGLGRQREFVVWQPASLTAMAAIAGRTPIKVWRDYLSSGLLNRSADLLPRAFVEERFDFYGKTLSGTPQLAARWKRGVRATNGALGDAVGKLYAARYFPPESKARVEALVQNVIAAFDRRIDHLEWMSDATTATAKAKLRALKVGVGYPDHWQDYSTLVIDPKDALGNAWRAGEFAYRHELAKLDRPVDRDEWFMTPQTVNAVNLPVLNALNFPAAILQPPFFDPQASAAANYGGVGATIGHEISHSFDSTGALFDDQGRLRNWWTKEDFAHFEASTHQLAVQFDTYRPFPDLAIKGQQTLGENIADLAGLQASFDAFHRSLGGQAAPVLDGLTGDQQFFLSFAQSWRNKSREPALRQQVLTDVHAPAPYRAQTVRNLDGWYDAFDVKAGQALYLAPADRVRIW